MDRIPIHNLEDLRSAPFFGDEDFLADDNLVTIVPNRRFNHTLSLSCGTLPPLKAYTPTQVPLWLARSLARRKLVTIEDPDWLSSEALANKLTEERNAGKTTLTDLPERFLETAYGLLRDAGDISEPTRVALEDLMCLRRGKIIDSVKELEARTLHLDVSSLTSAEIGLLRTGGLGILNKLVEFFGAKVGSDPRGAGQ